MSLFKDSRVDGLESELYRLKRQVEQMACEQGEMRGGTQLWLRPGPGSDNPYSAAQQRWEYVGPILRAILNYLGMDLEQIDTQATFRLVKTQETKR